MMFHKELTPERWFKFSLMEQLANVGMDIERAIAWKKRGDALSSRDAFERALELMILTVMDPKNRGGRLKELCRVKEALVDYFVYDNEYDTNDEYWQRYFLDFAYIAARERGR